jgi:hypothetical protein
METKLCLFLIFFNAKLLFSKCLCLQCPMFYSNRKRGLFLLFFY